MSVVLTAEEIREVDRLTIEENGVPGIALMENAAHRVDETLVAEFDPLDQKYVVILCGKGNNGGDGLALARILNGKVTRLVVVLACDPEELKGDAKVNYERLRADGVMPVREIPQKLRERLQVDIVVDALLGTGLKGPAEGPVLDLIRATREFPSAKIVSIDLPSGLGGGGECVRADITVTFTAPKAEHYLAEGAEENVGRLVVAQIGCPPQYVTSKLAVSDPREFAPLFAPRKKDGHKGLYGHVLVIGGAPGKSGAAAMAGVAALRMGAGLVSVTSPAATSVAPELMTETLEDFSLERKTVVAIGPGLGMNKELVHDVLAKAQVPAVIDADALNALAGTAFRGNGVSAILTPHLGEMARLLGRPVGDRLKDARSFATESNLCLVLKGHRTLVALPDGQVYINLSGSPAMAKGGAGDILTGMIAGMVAQFPDQVATAVRAAVYLHGRSGELAAEELTENCVLATDLLRFLPRAIREIA